jgi:parallel beta-helix repeat protein
VDGLLVAGPKERSLAIALLMLFSTLTLTGISSREASAYSLHQPILINGDVNFTAANGVTGGLGTESDPYIISGWQIYTNVANGIDIRGTTSHFVIRDVLIMGGPTPHSGIHMESVVNGWVENASLLSNIVGLDISFCSGIAAANCTFENNTWGVFAFACNQGVLVGDNFSGNQYYGVYLWESIGFSLADNSFKGDGVSLDGDIVTDLNMHSIPPSNLVNGKPIVYVTNQSGVDVSNVSVGQLIVVNCDGGTIHNVSAGNTSVGVEVAYSSNITIDDCDVLGCYQGLHIQYSNNMTATENRESQCNEGSRVNDCSRCNVVHNEVAGNERGLVLESCGNMVALNNSFSSNVNGIQGYYCTRSALVGNMIESTTFTSIGLSNCDNMTVAENTIQNSWGVSLYSSDHIHVFLNSFLQLGHECSDSLGENNRWNAGYPLGGNFWGTEIQDMFMGPSQNVSGSDGIGDGAYTVNSAGGIMDYYPLVNPPIYTSDLIASFYVSPKITNNVSTVFHLDASSTVYLLDPSVKPEVRWNWDGNGSWDVDWSLTKEADHSFSGPGVFSVALEARASNLTATAVYLVQIDVTEPTIRFDWINETFHSKNGSISWDALDSDSAVTLGEYRIDGGQWTPFQGNSGAVSIAELRDGKHLLEVRAYDDAGNVGHANLSFVIDTSILSPGGPFGPWILVSLVIAAIASAMVLLFYLRTRRGGGRGENSAKELGE